MSNKQNISITFAPPLSLLFLVLLVLKATGVVGWSWWWVTAPLWAPWLLFGLFLLFLLLAYITVAVFTD